MWRIYYDLDQGEYQQVAAGNQGAQAEIAVAQQSHFATT
jgi:hypothetical protein